jgi:aspartate/methionine/tyrosine aminotransferase
MAVFRERKAEFRRRRDYIVPALQGLGLNVPVMPDGAFYVWVDCSAFSDSSDAFAAELLEQAGVSVVPGFDFGVNQPQRYLRLSYANSMANLQEAVRRIGEWLQRRPSPRR